MNWEKRGAYRYLEGKPERKRPLRRPRSRWKDNVKMALQEVGWDMDWIYVGLVYALLNLRVP
jgi:hypothetical protein